MRALTEREVAAWVKANQGKGRAELTVGGIPWLVARLTAEGKVVYVLRYRSRDTKEPRTMTIGPVTLSAARERARDLLSQARVGTDPWEASRAARMAADEERKRADRTLARVAALWLASPDAQGWRPSTRRETERLMLKHWVLVFGDRDPDAITRPEVRKVLDEVAESAPSEADHARGALRGLFAWLHRERQEHLGVRNDPTAGLERARTTPRSRTYSDDELRRIVAGVKGTGLEDLVGILLHTGTRDRETRGMMWRDVDTARATWTVPAEMSKNRRPHVVALSTGALEVLRRRPRFGDHVFPNPATSTGFIERDQKTLSRVSRSLGFALRLHDVRRTVGDRLRQEFGESIMHAALGHADATLTRTYGPTPRLRALADAAEWWAGELARILGARQAEQRA